MSAPLPVLFIVEQEVSPISRAPLISAIAAILMSFISVIVKSDTSVNVKRRSNILSVSMIFLQIICHICFEKTIIFN